MKARIIAIVISILLISAFFNWLEIYHIGVDSGLKAGNRLEVNKAETWGIKLKVIPIHQQILKGLDD